MTNFSHGRAAESAAVEYLERLGYEIKNQNWRTKLCEIDIVAKKEKVIYFVEVKYRHGADQGEGMDYITPAKLKQMTFAARMWLADDGWVGDYRLAAIELTGDEYAVTEFLTELD